MVGLTESPITGPAGDREFLLYAPQGRTPIKSAPCRLPQPLRRLFHTPPLFAFFSGLREHNDPNWFKPRKAIYDAEVQAPFRALILALSQALEMAGVPLVGDPDRGIFRIYRDVRFSANKQLYKTHAGGVLTRSEQQARPGASSTSTSNPARLWWGSGSGIPSLRC